MNNAVKNSQMHPRNPHRQGYDFVALAKVHQPLQPFLAPSPSGKLSIDFSSPSAVKALNAALLAAYYKVHFWDIPDGFLCPGVPGRADYIHHIADLLARDKAGEVPQGKQIKGLDIGTGANLIYPIVGTQSYDWRFVGSELNPTSLASAGVIVNANPALKKKIKLRQAPNESSIFNGIINPHDTFSFSMCNPPFHASAEEALKGSQKKNKNLARHANKRWGKDSTAKQTSQYNFGGQHNELWCEGGEYAFVCNMIEQSKQYASQVRWFTSLISKKDHVEGLLRAAKQAGATQALSIEMAQGAKASRFIAWTYVL